MRLRTGCALMSIILGTTAGWSQTPTQSVDTPDLTSDRKTDTPAANLSLEHGKTIRVENAFRAAEQLGSKAKLCSVAIELASDNNLPAHFFTRLIEQESGFRSNVVSRAGARGIAQFMPQTAAERGLSDPFEPNKALSASAKFLSELVARFGNLGLAAAAYNAGPQRVHNWIEGRGQLPAETRKYVYNITGRDAESWLGNQPQIALASSSACIESNTSISPGVNYSTRAQLSAPASEPTEHSVRSRSNFERFQTWLKSGPCSQRKCIAVGHSTPTASRAFARAGVARLNKVPAGRIVSVGHSAPTRSTSIVRRPVRAS
jgi:hypothetical protein